VVWRLLSQSGSSQKNTRMKSATANERYTVDDDSNENSAVYLPTSLIQKNNHHNRRNHPIDVEDRSMKELDQAVASVSKMYLCSASLDNGDRSPTSVSYDMVNTSNISKGPIKETIFKNLSRSLPVDLQRVESSSGRSNISRSSRSSRSSRGSKGSRSSRRSSKRHDRLERKISETILSTCSEVEDSGSTFSTKECTDSACRSAQFILADLIHEAFKSMNEEALPQPPFRNGTSWSQNVSDRSLPPLERPEWHGLAFPVSLPPRHPDGPAPINQGSVASKTHQDLLTVALELGSSNDSGKQRHCATKSTVAFAPECQAISVNDPFAYFDPKCAPSNNIDAVQEEENESEASSFYVFEAQERSYNTPPQNNDSKRNWTSEFSMDDSLLQYSSTNGTSFSQLRKVSPISPLESASHSSGEMFHKKGWPIERTLNDISGSAPEMWTAFEASPFEDEAAFTDNFSFDAFLPFETSTAAVESFMSNVTPQGVEEIDPAWDTFKILPKSPDSVFSFFATDGFGKEHYDKGSRSGCHLGNGNENRFHCASTSTEIGSKCSL